MTLHITTSSHAFTNPESTTLDFFSSIKLMLQFTFVVHSNQESQTQFYEQISGFVDLGFVLASDEFVDII